MPPPKRDICTRANLPGSALVLRHAKYRLCLQNATPLSHGMKKAVSRELSQAESQVPPLSIHSEVSR